MRSATIWTGRILAALWAGWWIFFGVASGIGENLSPLGVFVHAALPGLIFGAIVLLAWKWEMAGGVSLVMIGLLALAAYPLLMFRNRPIRWDWYIFIILTMVLPPLLSGVLLLLHRRPAAPASP